MGIGLGLGIYSTMLSALIFNLLQAKLQEEIDEMSTAGEPIEYDVISKMEYLDKVWCETLRMWPFATVKVYGEGPGSVIFLPITARHYCHRSI